MRLEFRRKMEITFVFVVWVSGGQSGASTAVRVALGNSIYVSVPLCKQGMCLSAENQL